MRLPFLQQSILLMNNNISYYKLIGHYSSVIYKYMQWNLNV